MGKVLLFYKYVNIEYPKRVLKWQKKICADLGLKGRILIGTEGINGTVGGSEENCERYKQIMEQNPLFADIDYKESPGGANCFPKMQIKVKKEIVHLGIDPNELTPQDGGTHLTPEQVHQLLSDNPDDLIVLDTRNDFEWAVGKFKDAITPDIRHFRDFPQYVEDHLDEFKNKQVLMYCTGGIRCERATGVLEKRGIAKKVMQIKGGIHRYAEKYPDGFFRGKNYVFDNRIALRVNEDVLGNCYLCNVSCDEYNNCVNAMCNRHFICCDPCVEKYNYTCSEKCKELVATKQVPIRKKLQPIVRI